MPTVSTMLRQSGVVIPENASGKNAEDPKIRVITEFARCVCADAEGSACQNDMPFHRFKRAWGSEPLATVVAPYTICRSCVWLDSQHTIFMYTLIQCQ